MHMKGGKEKMDPIQYELNDIIEMKKSFPSGKAWASAVSGATWPK